MKKSVKQPKSFGGSDKKRTKSMLIRGRVTKKGKKLMGFKK